jgi:hypothetical protein
MGGEAEEMYHKPTVPVGDSNKELQNTVYEWRPCTMNKIMHVGSRMVIRQVCGRR